MEADDTHRRGITEAFGKASPRDKRGNTGAGAKPEAERAARSVQHW